MLYEIRYMRDGKEEVYQRSYAQCLTLADYLKRVFRIDAIVVRVG